MSNLIIILNEPSGVITTNITYIQFTDKTRVSMDSAHDLEDSKVLSYKIADTRKNHPANSVIVKELRRVEKPPYVHSDMGSQYTRELF